MKAIFQHQDAIDGGLGIRDTFGMGKKHTLLRWFRRLAMLLAFLALAAFVFRLSLPVALRWAANHLLPGVLNAPVSLQGVNLGLMAGRIEIIGLRVGQPPGFGPNWSIALDRALVEIDLGSIRHPPFRIRNAMLDGAEFNLADGPGSNFNTSALFDSEAPEGARIADTNAAVFPVIIVERLELTNGFFAYADYSDAALSVEARVGELSGIVTNLVIAPESKRAQWGRGMVRLAGRLAQAPGTGAPFSLECALEAFGDYIPRIVGGIHADSLELAALEDMFGLVFLKDVKDELLAFRAEFDLSPEAIQCSAHLEADAGLLSGSVGLVRWEWDTGIGLLRDLRIAQPQDYGNGLMLSASEIRVRMGMTNASDDWTRIEEFFVSGLEASLLINTNGELNATAWIPKRSNVDTRAAVTPAPDGGVVAGRVALSNIVVTLRAMDDACGVPDIRVDSFMLTGTNLAFGNGQRPPGSGGGELAMTVAIADSQAMPITVRLDSGAGLGHGPLLWIDAGFPCVDVSAIEPWVPIGFLEALSGTDAAFTLSGCLDLKGIEANACVRNMAGEPILTADQVRCGWDFNMLETGVFRVRQPIGCGTGWLVSAQSAELRLNPGVLPRISLLRIENAEATLLSMKDGSLNVEALAVPDSGNTLMPASSDAIANAPDMAGLAFDAIEMRNVVLNFEKEGVAGRVVRIEGMNGQAAGLRIGASAKALPGRVQLDGRLCQPGHSSALFQADVKMNPIADGVPPMDVGLRVRGFRPAAFMPELHADNLPGLFRNSLSIDGKAALNGTVVDGGLTVKTTEGDSLISLERIVLDWSRGDFVLENLRMAKAECFGMELLLHVPEARVRVESGSLFAPPVVLEYAGMRGVDVRMIRDVYGRLNSECRLSSADSETDVRSGPEQAVFEPIVIRRFELENAAISYADYSRTQAPLLLRMFNLDALATNVVFADLPGESPAVAGGLMLHGRLDQSPYPDAMLGVIARFGALGKRVPDVDAAVALMDLDLNAFASVVPQATLDSIGRAPMMMEAIVGHDPNSLGAGLRVGMGGGRDLVALDRIELELDHGSPTGRLRLRGFRVFQPEGFGDGLLFSLPVAEVFCTPDALFRPLFMNCSGYIERPELNIVILSNGVANTSVVFFRTGVGSGTNAAPPTSLKEARVKQGASVSIRTFVVSNATFRLRDHQSTGLPQELAFTNIMIDVTNLLVNAARLDEAAPGGLRATARLCQHGFDDAWLGVCARTAPLVWGQPELNVSVRVGGVELKPLKSILPTGASIMLGGDALDVSADFQATPGKLYGLVGSEIIGGNSLPLLKIGGTPFAPQLDRSHIFFSIGARLGGQIGGAFKNTFHLGTDLTRTAYDATSELRNGARSIISGAGKGLLGTMVGVADANARGVISGLVATTFGTVSKTFSTAFKTGEFLVDGTLDAPDVNERVAARWRMETQARWARKWEQALRLIESTPLPFDK